MADKDFQVIFVHSSGLAKDNAINTLHFDISAPDTVEGRCDDIKAALEGLRPVLSNAFPKLQIKVYPPGPNPGGPEFSKEYTFTAGGGNPGPAEVAVCLSYATVDDPESSTPRRRGRIYIGPLAANATNAPRPDATLRDYVLDYGEALASAGTASNTTWKMYSQRDNAYAKIESIWVDDAWDTQRRRGAAPTLRDSRDVQ